MPDGLWSKLEQTWPARAAQGMWQGLMAPGNALASTTPMTSDQMIAPAMGMAGMMYGGSAGAIPEGALGSGMARMRMIENADQLKELANIRRSQGMAVGKSAPGHDFSRPDAPRGSWADLVARTKAKWEGDKARAVGGYQDVAPGAVPSSPYMKPEDWEFIAKNGGLAVPLTAGLGLAASQDDR